MLDGADTDDAGNGEAAADAPLPPEAKIHPVSVLE